jgi:hypothetical protein
VVQFGPQRGELVVDAAVACPHPGGHQAHDRAGIADAGQEHQDAEDHQPPVGGFTGYATVTVTDPAVLDDACAALEADAAAARIEVRRMWFAQDSGFALGALPLGLGLPKRRW